MEEKGDSGLRASDWKEDNTITKSGNSSRMSEKGGI